MVNAFLAECPLLASANTPADKTLLRMIPQLPRDPFL